MWYVDRNIELGSLPNLVVKQTQMGTKPCELIELPISVLDYIKTHQLTKINVLMLAGLNTEEARDILLKSLTNIEVSAVRRRSGKYERKKQKRR